MKKNILLIISFLLFPSMFTYAASSATSFAENKTFPGCVNIGYNFAKNKLVLNPSAPSSSKIFILHNISKNAVLLDHESNAGAASAGWSSQLNADKWSAISMSKANFDLSCMANQNGKYQVIDCQKVLKICAVTPIQAMNNFWLVENTSLENVKAKVSR